MRSAAFAWILATASLCACAGLVGIVDVSGQGGDAATTDGSVDAHRKDAGPGAPDGGAGDGAAGDGAADTSTVVVPYDSSVPPAPTVSAAVTGTGRIHTFAVRRLYLGDSAPTAAFTPNPNAWQTLGYDLDGLDTTRMSATNTCTPFTPGDGVIDGVGGIDNAFGSNFLGNSLLYNTLRVAISQGTNAAGDAGLSSLLSLQIAAGGFTSVLDTEGLDDSVAGQTAIGLDGRYFAGAPYPGIPPHVSPSDAGDSGTGFALDANWPINPASLVDAGLDAGPHQFANAYVTNSVFVSGPLHADPVAVPLVIVIEGAPLTLTIHHVVVSFTYSVDAHGQGHATHGILAGALRTQELLASFASVLGRVSGGEFCGTFDALVVPIVLNAQDLILSETDEISNGPGTPCNAVSIGLGFDADEIQIPNHVAPPLDAGDAPPCGFDAGD